MTSSTLNKPIISFHFYGGETWTTNKKEEKTLNQIQENIIRRIIMVPQTTPIETLYIETGAARHHNNHHQKSTKHGETTEKTTTQNHNENNGM